jgi:BirA family biotin operon repressor/biotin-[acetyl-CoA-carboxylase] ligase
MSIQQHHFPTLFSTQSFLKENWEQLRPESDSILISTNQQTEGTGRQGSSWKYFEGSLAMSFAISSHRPFLGLTSLEVGCLVAEFFNDFPLYLKWPNDLFFQNKKCGGVILQNLSHDFLACGVGLNINQQDNTLDTIHDGQAASSLQLVNQTSLKTLSHQLYKYILNNRMDSEGIRKEFLKRCIHLNKQCTLKQGQKVLAKGKFTGIGEQGEALIKSTRGDIESHYTGSLYWDES